jgi:hypothetical protein
MESEIGSCRRIFEEVKQDPDKLTKIGRLELGFRLEKGVAINTMMQSPGATCDDGLLGVGGA